MTHATDTKSTAECRRTPWWAWAAPLWGLLWLALPAVDLSLSDPSIWQSVLAGAGLIAFGGLFLLVVMTERPLLVPLAAMAAISAVLTLAAIDSFALMFVYVASAAAVRLPARDAALAVGGVTAVAAATLALTDAESALFWSITGTVLGTATLWFLIGGILRSNAELREARAELAELAVAEERLRFARDMHDLLGRDLSLIALKAELAGKLLPTRVDDAADEVADIRSLSRSALTQVREAVDGYRRPTLSAELSGARVALEAAGIELSVDGAGEGLDPDVESVLAWAVREGATNVIRHSGATHAEIRVTAGAAGAELEISDDGRGRPASNGAGGRGEPGASPATQPEGHGLAGLIERAHALGGTVEAAADPDGGFRLRVSLPAGAREMAA
jgi:two-component system, NarL family, sensor histidine kinase DesK